MKGENPRGSTERSEQCEEREGRTSEVELILATAVPKRSGGIAKSPKAISRQDPFTRSNPTSAVRPILGNLYANGIEWAGEGGRSYGRR